MSDIAEGIGGVVEGALSGRAVEPATGRADVDGEGSASVDCSNCGAMVASTYCPECGQKAHVHRSLTAIFHDLIHGVLHLDGKFWRTLPLLIFKPGKLTRRYVDGERVKFVSPMAMFLFSVFAMFAVFQMIGLSTPTNLDLDTPIESIRAEGLAEAERIQSEIGALPDNDPQRQELEQELSILESMLEGGEVQGENSTSEDASNFTTSFSLPGGGSDGNLTGIEVLDQGIIKKWQENPEMMLYKMQANGYKFSWLLIPFSIPFVWLLFAWKRRFKAYDHAVFVTYSLGFMSLLFIIMSLVWVSPLGSGWAILIFVIAAPLHVYKQLRHTYDLRRFSAIWRFAALFFFINIVLALFLQALLLIGAF